GGGEGGGGGMALWGPDDLHAEGKAGGGEAARRGGGGQDRRARVAGPEEMVGHRYRHAVDVDGALVTLAMLVMRERRHAGHGAEQQIVGREELRPGQAHAVARLV